ncbi:MAG: mRNA binding protein puf3 [Claussenomyces sp. TS43310]|nr:MAG: mRNA binding protein puf3 [Claussenomyces sp. TS43310]
MSSATLNRPSGAMPNAVRTTTQFGDFPSATARTNGDDKTSQSSTLGQKFGSNSAWQSSGGIWGNAIGSGLLNGKREPSRSRGKASHECISQSSAPILTHFPALDEDALDGRSGSGALAASSEADLPWSSRTNGPWNIDKTSPTTLSTSQSGSTSPVRHRGSNTSIPSLNFAESQQTSPFLTTSRPTIGQGPGIPSRGQQKSALDPASGPFKYPYSNGAGFTLYNDDKENKFFGRDAFDVDSGNRNFGLDQRSATGSSFRSVQGSSHRDASLPSSRQSDTNPNGSAGSFFPNGYAGFGHSASNSLQFQRPSDAGRNASISSIQNNRNFPSQVQELDSSLASMQLQDKTASTKYIDPTTGDLAKTQLSDQQQYSTQSQLDSPSNIWDSSGPKTNANYLSDPYAGSFNSQLNFKAAQMNDRDSVSPHTSFRSNTSSSKFHADAGVSALDLERAYALRSPIAPDLERILQRQQFPAQHQQFFQPPMMYPGQYGGQYGPPSYDYPSQQQNYRSGSGQFGFQIPLAGYGPVISVPRGPARDQDVGHGVRSALLEEFRSNAKSNKRYELKDIYNHVVEFSGDQHGSRFIQQKLEGANSDEKDQIFREIQPNALQLMTDVFGNYVIQKMFEHGSQVQKRVLAEHMRNHVHELSVQMYGCRVVQKALEHVLADQQAELVKELQPGVLACVKDQNGNHVIQKAIERVPTEHIQFIIEAFKGQVHVLATHPYGCRVIQRMLEYCSDRDQAAILEELFACASMLITDQYGNYVTQHVIAHGRREDRDKIIKIVTAQLLTLSKHKFASNVVEKSIQCGTDEQRHAIVANLTALHSDGSSPLQLMMKDQYGNYVIQKLLGILKGAEREQLIEDIKPQLLALKKFNFGKQIAAIEKLIYTGPQMTRPALDQQSPKMRLTPSLPGSSTLPIDIGSSVATPMLTTEQNSPQSSSLPSTNASTCEVPTQIKTTLEGDMGSLEVKI